jgi:alpha-glucosidase (family GH31 glycosyl hydrolase)
MPPLWGLGVWYRGKSQWNQARMESIASEFRRRQIPCDVYGLEPMWQTASYPCTYVWNRKMFPDPAGFIRKMGEQGFKVNLWEHAFIRESSPIAKEIKPFCSPDGRGFGGLAPDFTMLQAREIFFGIHKREHLDIGVAAYKLDECDGSDFTGGWYFPDTCHFPGGMTGAEMHNLYGLLYQKTMYDGIRQALAKRSMFLCRGNYTGGQRYPTGMYSDTYDLKEYIRTLVNSGLTQHLYCPEIRGGKEFERRLRLMMFSAVAQDNEWSDGTMPWQHSAQGEQVFRLYGQRRMQLLPYLYSHFWLGYRTGVGLIRSLIMEHPDDPAAWSQDQSYYFGKFMLIAPQWDKQRDVYLPEGQWYGYWDGRPHAGRQSLKAYEAAEEHLPAFVKAGAIIPLVPWMNYVGEKPWDPMTLDIWPGAPSASARGQIDLYEDDGTTYDFERGVYRMTPITCVTENGTTTVTLAKPEGTGFQPASLAGTGKPRRLILQIHGPQPKEALLGSQPIPPDRRSYDAGNGLLTVETQQPEGPMTLRLTW